MVLGWGITWSLQCLELGWKEMLQPNARNEGEEYKKKEEEESLREKKAEYEDKDEQQFRKNEEGESKGLPLSKRQKRRQKEKWQKAVEI
ncbi:hypothetical protein ACROYT_G015585 [Oculina patagonica]